MKSALGDLLPQQNRAFRDGPDVQNYGSDNVRERLEGFIVLMEIPHILPD